MALSKVLGLFPLGKRDGVHHLTFAAVYSGASILAIIIFTGYVAFFLYSPKIVIVLLENGMIAIFSAVFISSFLCPVRKLPIFLSGVKTLSDVHSIVGSARYLHLTLLLLLPASLKIVFLLDLSKYPKLIYFWLSTCCTLVISDQFVAFCCIFGSQFKALKNEFLKDFASRPSLSYDTLLSCYNELVSASVSINKVYSLQILSINFFKGTAEVYLALDVVLDPPDQYLGSKESILITCKLCWLLFSLGLSLHIVAAANFATSQAREFNTLLYQLMIDDKTNELLNNEKLKLHISMKREVVFTACGFFNLDYTLIHSIIASATTYLVILIQFGQPPSAPHYNVTYTTESTFLTTATG